MKEYVSRVAFEGHAICKVLVFDPPSSNKSHKYTTYEEEFERFKKAREKAIEELDNLYNETLQRIGEAKAILFQTHKLMAEDLDFEDAVNALISEGNIAEVATKSASKELSMMFEAMDDEYMKARALDVIEVGNLICDIILGKNDIFKLSKDTIVIASDLPSNALMKFNPLYLKGLVLINGNSNSHVSILARALEIPTLVAVKGLSLNDISLSTIAILDATNSKGKLVLDASESKISDYKLSFLEYDKKMESLRAYIGKPSLTKDGYNIKIYANITASSEIDNVNKNDAQGIGLFRSEFIYLNSKDYPLEDEQFKYYKEVVSKMNNKEVIIRTLDIGADKKVDYFDLPNEENPALGYRSIRICKDRPNVFLTQLKALYRASFFGKLSIMVPMIVSLNEVYYVKKMCQLAKDELKKASIPFDENVKVGIMIETPAAAICSDILAKHVDFFSIGTNDLSQYTLACDRLNPMLNNTFNPHHKSILRLIYMIVTNAHKAGIVCGMCGELAHDEALLPFLVGIHIDELSCSAAYCLQVRKAISEIDANEVNLDSFIGE